MEESKKTFLILGLGFFGQTAAESLIKYGQNVIAIDKDMAKVERIADEVSQAICLDFTDYDQLTSVAVDAVDIAIVATGDDLQSAILAILNLKDLKIKKIVAKANDITGRKVLKKIGADIIVTPEADTAKMLSKKLAFENIIDLFDIDGNYSVMEIHVLAKWVNRSLAELNLRNNYNLNVLGIRKNGKLSVNIDPHQKLNENDQLLIIGKNDLYNRLKD